MMQRSKGNNAVTRTAMDAIKIQDEVCISWTELLPRGLSVPRVDLALHSKTAQAIT